MKCERVETEVVKMVETKVKEISSYNLSLSPVEVLVLRAILGNFAEYKQGEIGSVAAKIRQELERAGFYSRGEDLISFPTVNFKSLKELKRNYIGPGVEEE